MQVARVGHMPSETTIPAARGFVRNLNILLKFARLYGLEHSRSASQFDSTFEELTEAVDAAGSAGLLLGAAGSQILLDGVPLESTPAERSFANLLTVSGIASICFGRGLERGDFERFVRVFMETGPKSAGLAEKLEVFAGKNSNSTIRVNEIRFVAEDSGYSEARVAAQLTARTLGADSEAIQEWFRSPEKMIQLIAAAEGNAHPGGAGSGQGFWCDERRGEWGCDRRIDRIQWKWRRSGRRNGRRDWCRNGDGHGRGKWFCGRARNATSHRIGHAGPAEVARAVRRSDARKIFGRRRCIVAAETCASAAERAGDVASGARERRSDGAESQARRNNSHKTCGRSRDSLRSRSLSTRRSARECGAPTARQNGRGTHDAAQAAQGARRQDDQGGHGGGDACRPAGSPILGASAGIGEAASAAFDRSVVHSAAERAAVRRGIAGARRIRCRRRYSAALRRVRAQ